MTFDGGSDEIGNERVRDLVRTRYARQYNALSSKKETDRIVRGLPEFV